MILPKPPIFASYQLFSLAALSQVSTLQHIVLRKQKAAITIGLKVSRYRDGHVTTFQKKTVSDERLF